MNVRDVTRWGSADGAVELQAQMLGAVGQPVVATDLDGLIVSWNRSAARTFGWSPEEVLGRDLHELLSSQPTDDATAPVVIDDEGRAVWSGEFELLRRDGSRFPAIVTGSPVRDSSGAFVAIVHVTTDISEQKAREAAQGRLSSIVASSQDAIVGLDLCGVVTSWNAAAAAVFAVSERDALGADLATMVPDPLGSTLRRALEAVAAGREPGRFEGELEPADQRRRVELELAASAVRDGAGAVVGASLIVRDVTESNLLRRRAQDQGRRLVAAQRQAHLGSFEVDVRTGETSWSEELSRILGLPIDAAPSVAAYVERVHPSDHDELVVWADHAVDEQGPSVMTHRIVRPDGAVRWVTITTAHEPQSVVVTGTVIDVTETAELQRNLERQATHDPATGLPNRGLIADRVDLALAVPDAVVTVLVVGIDDFKLVNDSFGHSRGDEAIAWLAQELESAVHPGDTVGRFAGNQFAVVCTHCDDTDAALALAEDLRRVALGPAILGGVRLNLHLSIGVALTHHQPLDAAGVLWQAEAAMFAAKESGKHQAKLFDDELRNDSREELRIESVLRAALAEDTVQVHYQPVIRLGDGVIVGAEALLRVEDPLGGGWLPSDRVVAVAERSGLVSELGEFVLLCACREAAVWKDLRPEVGAVASVNISAGQLLDSRLERFVRQTLEETGIEPGLLCLEVSESALTQDLRLSAAKLADLRRLGIRLAADDFGTGYSNLAHLKRLPLDAIKADRSYISGIDHNADDNAISGAVLRLGRSLGFEVVAEGVERPEQVAELVRQGCRLAQGFLFSRPVDPARFRELLVAEPTGFADPGPAPCPTPGADASPTTEASPTAPDGDSAQVGLDAMRAIAHELRNPLTVVSGYAELLAVADDAETAESAALIGRAAQRIEDILRYLEDVNAVQDGTIQLTARPTDVVALVEQVVADARRIRAGRDVRLIVDGPVTAELDEDQVAECLVNLIGNADKYAPAGTPTEVSVRTVGDRCVVEVDDRGPGIALESAGTIFRKFSRLDRTTPGSGLGLFLVRGIARAHGGDVTYRPRNPGPGSTFELALPLRQG